MLILVPAATATKDDGMGRWQVLDETDHHLLPTATTTDDRNDGWDCWLVSLLAPW